MSELSQEARALIDSVSKLDDPSPNDRARVKQRVALSIGAAAFSAVAVTQLAGGTGPGVLGTVKAGLWSTTGKLALCAGVVGGALALSWPNAHTASRAAGGQRQIASAVLPLAAQAPAAAPVPADPAPAETPNVPAELAAATASAAAPARVRGRAAPERGPAAEQAPGPAPQTAAPDPQSTLASELALLGEAQAALRAGQPEQALALARKHQARFPAGLLREERLGIETLSDCMLGRKDPARAEAFLRTAPDSPLAARVRKACGLE